MKHKLPLLALLLAFAVIVMGAYVRLADAGLGCPDWPGCYGHLIGVPDEAHEIAAVRQAYPGSPPDSGKAWKEMIHRYLAGTLGLLILAIAAHAWKRRETLPVGLPTTLLALVMFQALLGMWTVTLLLKPVVVTAHLLGGMTTLGLLAWLAMSRLEAGRVEAAPGTRILARAGLVVLALQIALGGWVSANYAALACTDFPVCNGRWLPDMDLAAGFSLDTRLGTQSAAALVAVHWVHRLGALVTVAVLGWLAACLWYQPGTRPLGAGLAALLAIQVSLGIANVLLAHPLLPAVAHNAVAALLVVCLVAILYRTGKTRSESSRLVTPRPPLFSTWG
jgi:cytochrome c oxidase assembly protein subunit 15